MYPARPILLVDDEREMLTVLELALSTEGISNTVCLTSGTAALHFLEEETASVVLLDLRLPDVKEFELLSAIREKYPAIPVVMITGENDVETAVQCMRLGARDYLTKPVEPRRLTASVAQALEMGELREEYQNYLAKATQDQLDNPEAFKGIVAESGGMRAVFQYIETIANSRKPVLILGESGVGKELIARAVHDLSSVSGPYISETVAGYDDTMFSDALFGHVSGAYTGATGSRGGLVQSAESGTLFLDEIGDLSSASQVKLLRLIQEREFRALGSDKTQRTNARFVFATNRDLVKMRDEETFRSDLFYRISTHLIEVPPLRRRRRDIAPLLRHFVKKAAADLDIKPPAIPHALIQLLNTYSFPGNVRELEAMTFDAVTKSHGHSLSLNLFEPHIAREVASHDLDTGGQELRPMAAPDIFEGMTTLPTLSEIQHQLIDEAMRRSDNNQGIAARFLGISRTALNKRLHQGEHDKP